MFIIVIVVMSLISLFIWVAWQELAEDMKSDVDVTEADEIIDEVTNRYPSMIDGLVMLIFLGMWIFGVAASYFSESHPFLFGMMMILVVFVIIAGMILGNFYEELFEDEELSGIPDDFPVLHWVLTHLLIIGIVMAVSMAMFYFRGKGK
jgi:pilus assembly protein TadC